MWVEAELGVELTITSLFRINDNGVHGTLPVRGTDVRMRCESIGNNIADRINRNWKYDADRPKKKCAYAHGEGDNFHLHLQVHPNTTFQD